MMNGTPFRTLALAMVLTSMQVACVASPADADRIATDPPDPDKSLVTDPPDPDKSETEPPTPDRARAADPPGGITTADPPGGAEPPTPDLDQKR